MDLKAQAANLLNSAPLRVVYNVFGGLSEFYAFVFMSAGITLAFMGKLDANFAGMIVAVQGILCAHEAMDEYHERKTSVSVTVNNS